MINNTNEREEKNPFRGKPKRAVARLHRLTHLACEHLPPETLNRASFHLAAYLDAALMTLQFGDDMQAELEGERVSGNRLRPDLSLADRKLLKQFGIKV
jgi:hypothetical protein